MDYNLIENLSKKELIDKFIFTIRTGKDRFLKQILNTKKIKPHELLINPYTLIDQNTTNSVRSNNRIIIMLIKYGFDINFINDDGKNVLMEWLEREYFYYEYISTLINGPNINLLIIDNDGKNIYHYLQNVVQFGVINGKLQSLDQEDYVNINKIDNYGNSPIMNIFLGIDEDGQYNLEKLELILHLINVKNADILIMNLNNRTIKSMYEDNVNLFQDIQFTDVVLGFREIFYENTPEEILIENLETEIENYYQIISSNKHEKLLSHKKEELYFNINKIILTYLEDHKQFSNDLFNKLIVQREIQKILFDNKELLSPYQKKYVETLFDTNEDDEDEDDEDHEMCGICQESIKNENNKIILKCKHTFHQDCIDIWFSEENQKYRLTTRVPGTDRFIHENISIKKKCPYGCINN